jgi:hypothetical protein
MAYDVTVTFQNGSRETFKNVDDAVATSKNKFKEFLVQKYSNPGIMDTVVKITHMPSSTTPVAPPKDPNEANIGHYGDKNRWRNLGGGYWHNLDTHEIQLR